jgi:dynein heavy chain
LKKYINSVLGEYFVDNHIITLEDSYKESNCSSPLIFVLMPGDDP